MFKRKIFIILLIVVFALGALITIRMHIANNEKQNALLQSYIDLGEEHLELQNKFNLETSGVVLEYYIRIWEESGVEMLYKLEGGWKYYKADNGELITRAVYTDEQVNILLSERLGEFIKII